MTSQIRILDDALVDQIAAGEVIERPANLVKELLENAVDAGGNTITVEIEKGGLSLVRVTDDGIGMSSEDISMSLKRHATSKLASSDDLARISTLGFRGEAIPSIAAVSRFTVTSRTKELIAGTRISVEGGLEVNNIETGCAAGTIVEARDLFYNVPARRKFLKSRTTESAHITTACQRIVLAFPHLRLTLIRDGRTVLEFLPTTSFIQRVMSIFPKEELVSIEKSQDSIAITAALGAPERSRTTSTSLYMFVNNRPVRDPSLSRAVIYAYGSVLLPGRRPIGAVSIKVPSDQVDVNVHPQKLEVRFTNSNAVFDTITRLIAQDLGTSAWSGPAARRSAYISQPPSTPSYLSLNEKTQESSAIDHSREVRENSANNLVQDPWGLSGEGSDQNLSPKDYSMVSSVPKMDKLSSTASRSLELFPRRGFFGSLRVLGQIRRLFLICEGQDALHIIDQHASDERVRFHQLKNSYKSQSIKMQQLLFPEQVECSEIEIAFFNEHQTRILELGFDCDRVGPTTLAVRSIPTLLGRASPERLLHDLIAELSRIGDRAYADAIDRTLATMACHGAIRAGDPISIEEANSLLRAMDEVDDFAGHCPHGRPVVYSIHLDELERKLGR